MYEIHEYSIYCQLKTSVERYLFIGIFLSFLVDSSLVTSPNITGLYRDSSAISDLNSVNLNGSVWQQSVSSPQPSIPEQSDRGSLSLSKTDSEKVKLFPVDLFPLIIPVICRRVRPINDLKG